MSRKNASDRRAIWFLWGLGGALAGSFVSVTAGQGFPTLPSRPEKAPAAKPPAKNAPPQQPELWEPGDEVDDPKAPGTATKDGSTGKNPSAPTQLGGAPGDETPTWSVLVATYTREDHADVARAMQQRLAGRFPTLRDCFVERVAGGSAILVGRFTKPDDPGAQAKLKEVKAITADGTRPFATAMLTRTKTISESAGELDISNLRELYPKVVPMYSLQVAAWSTFGEKSLSPAEIRAAAERYCKELRMKGFEAWVHHDATSNTSVVTVGHFDRRAYDSKSTLYSTEVEALMKKFPRHLLNGEEALIPVDPSKPDGKTRPQGCRLVEVPR